jgi:hypothetical protein
MKKIFSLLLIFIFFFTSHTNIFANELPQVVFINHIRGDDCCNEGSFENFENQIETFEKYNIPATFVFRYDALIDKKYKNKISEIKNNPLFEFGIMVEIVPKLAKDSNVTYESHENNWHQAQNAFSIGYLPSEKEKIIDTLMNAFWINFQTYPEISTAWIIDTKTLQYSQEKYGLKIHQIAREQLGLDSYTLSGGPPHYPYSSNKDWFFIPNKSDEESVLILRHTLADPLYEYGDQTSSFTSQPNDYVLDGKDFSYFKKLLDQALFNQNTRGYANLGLENSMTVESHEEFFKQIDYVSKLRDDQKITVTKTKELINYWTQEKVTIYKGEDIVSNKDQEVFWITTPGYRVRLRRNKNNLFIDDIRIYEGITDPYQNFEALSSGHLITPAIINYSESWYENSNSFLKKLILKNKILNIKKSVPQNDLNKNNVGLLLPKLNQDSYAKIESKNNLISINYLDENNKNIEITFDENSFSINGIDEPDFSLAKNFSPTSLENNSLAWKNNDFISLNWSCANDECLFKPNNKSINYEDVVNKYKKYLLPDPGLNIASEKYSQIFPHNDFALANINPIRIIVSLKDEDGLTALTKNDPIIKTSDPVKKIEVVGNPKSESIFYIDIYNDKPLKTKATISIENIEQEVDLTFAPFCKNEIKYCVTHPRQTLWFLQNKIQEKIQILEKKL